jgi:Zinc dependent phospholipase C
MPAALTHKAIMLMARERLAEIKDVVQQGIARRTAAGSPVTNLETRLLALVTAAHAQMSTLPHSDASVPGQLFTRPLEDRVSKFAVMGAMGPDITAFSSALQPGQQWPFDLLHKGTPDGDRELLIAGTCDLALEIWAEARNRLSDEPNRDKARAYVLGHLCHVAGDVISHPFINDIEWHDGTEARAKLDHADGEGSHDAMVAQKVFMRDGTRGGESWGKWWPELNDVPQALFDAYEQGLENVYKARTQRPHGFGNFERKLAELDPPGLDVSFVKDGYSLYRSGVIDVAYGFGFGKWFGMLAFLFAPAIFTPLLVHALPRGQQFFVHTDDPAEEDSERKWFEALSLPLYIGAIDSLIYGFWVASLTSKGVKERTIAGLVVSGIVTLALVGYAIELHSRGMSKEARWPLFFALPLAIALTFLIIGSADAAADGKKRRSAVAFIHAMPLLQFVVFIVALFFVFQFGQFEMKLDEPVFWVLFVFWLLFCGLLWVLLSFKARDARIPENPDTFAAQTRHAVRLFDDASQFRDPVATALGRPDRFYPSGRRQIMRLWWEGTGTMSVRSDRYGLVFRLESGDSTTEQELPAPIAPMKPTEYLGFLAENVADRDGSTGKLKGAMMFPELEEDYELPPGATFAAHGDTESTQAKRREESAKFKELGSNSDSDFILHHAPKPMRAIRFAPSGPMANPFDLDEGDLVSKEVDDGYLYPHDQLEGRSSDTIMSYAADVAAFLCMAGASRMDPAGTLPPVHQVFRNWNLDRRRINEWKMLVAGGALSEKPDGPATYDATMLYGQFAPADTAAWFHPMSDATMGGSEAAVREGDEAMRKEGWVRLLRRWLELERQPDQNLIDPAARLFPDWQTNQQLSRGLAYLLDFPDPA